MIAQMIFESNIGTNKFQELLETQILELGPCENMQEHTQLLKATVDYKIKTEEFERALLMTTIENANKFTVKQLEVVIWAVAKRLDSEWKEALSETNKALI